MANLHRVLLTLPILLALNATPLAQAPASTDSSPALPETLNFIVNKLGTLGRLNFAASMHDNTSGDEWVVKWSTEMTNMRASASACRLDYHWWKSRDGEVVGDVDMALSFKDVLEVSVMPMNTRIDEANAKAGHADYVTIQVNPPTTVIVAKRNDGDMYFDMSDESLANRVAKAMVHAVELCGGGSKEPF